MKKEATYDLLHRGGFISEKPSEYPCCADGICPQHRDAAIERYSSRELDKAVRRLRKR
jgi:hypothetical protein